MTDKESSQKDQGITGSELAVLAMGFIIAAAAVSFFVMNFGLI